VEGRFVADRKLRGDEKSGGEKGALVGGAIDREDSGGDLDLPGYFTWRGSPTKF
jgi:hypothetical protein